MPLSKPSYSRFLGKLFQLVVFAGFVCFKRERAQRRKIKRKKYFIEILDQHLNTVFLKLSRRQSECRSGKYRKLILLPHQMYTRKRIMPPPQVQVQLIQKQTDKNNQEKHVPEVHWETVAYTQRNKRHLVSC